MGNIFTASKQWAERPDDERFWDLAEMEEAVRGYQQTAETSTYKFSQLRAVQVLGDSVALKSPTGAAAVLTNYAFGQLANRLGAPASYLRKLPGETATGLLNYHFTHTHDDSDAVVLHHKANGYRVARCVTSEKYVRVWNSDVVSWLRDLPAGWRNVQAMAMEGCRTRPATEADCLKSSNLGIRPGETISPAGLYASDRDMFAFLVNDDRAVEWKGHTLFRGVIVSNSEVGNGSLRMTMFLFDDVCRNHIIWGAEKVLEVRVRHIGDSVRRSYLRGQRRVVEAADLDTGRDLELLNLAWSHSLGNDKDQVVRAVRHNTSLSEIQANRAWDVAVQHEDDHGDPTTAYAQMSAITRMSQEKGYQDGRDDLDRQGRRILEMAF